MNPVFVKLLATLLTVMLLSSGLAACGKRSPVVPPPDVPNTYPRVYPSDNN